MHSNFYLFSLSQGKNKGYPSPGSSPSLHQQHVLEWRPNRCVPSQLGILQLPGRGRQLNDERRQPVQPEVAGAGGQRLQLLQLGPADQVCQRSGRGQRVGARQEDGVVWRGPGRVD